jgi:hypothetical protein
MALKPQRSRRMDDMMMENKHQKELMEFANEGKKKKTRAVGPKAIKVGGDMISTPIVHWV